jgi:ABC-type iron transport system FetAB permease component
VMWWVLLPGAMGCLLLSCFFPVEDARFQIILVLGLSGFVAMVLFVIISLDRPLNGVLAISPESYELIYDQLMKR